MERPPASPTPLRTKFYVVALFTVTFGLLLIPWTRHLLVENDAIWPLGYCVTLATAAILIAVDATRDR